MSVYLDKFWKFWDRFWKLCRWLEGAEGIGLVEKTRNLEGTFTRTRQEGCLEILKEKFKGVADEKRLEEVLTSETVLVVKCKEAEEELFNPMWEIIYRRSEMREEWMLTLPLEATTLASAEHFTVPKSSTPEADWVVARSDTFDKILMWEEGMPEGSLRREFTFKGDEVTLITMLYGCSKAKSVAGVGDDASIIGRYRNDSFHEVLRILFYARTSSCVCVLEGFRTHCSSSTLGLFFTSFISTEGNPKIVIFSAITLVFRNKSQISPTLYR